MMLLGWCEKCRKVKNVRASAHALAQFQMRRTVVGTCLACIEGERKKR